MPLVIAKTLLPDTACFYLAIGRVFGIGRANGLAIAEQAGISKEARVADLKAHHVQKARTHACPSLCCAVQSTAWQTVLFSAVHVQHLYRQMQGKILALCCKLYVLLLGSAILTQCDTTPPTTTHHAHTGGVTDK